MAAANGGWLSPLPGQNVKQKAGHFEPKTGRIETLSAHVGR
jgi:hypothetical protein